VPIIAVTSYALSGDEQTADRSAVTIHLQTLPAQGLLEHIAKFLKAK